MSAVARFTPSITEVSSRSGSSSALLNRCAVDEDFVAGLDLELVGDGLGHVRPFVEDGYGTLLVASSARRRR